MHPDGDIVLTGISGRYPECNNIEEFKDALLKGTDLVTVDDRRFPPGALGVPVGIGKIPEIDKFDATYFGVHPKQADFMDPRHRILMETIYECIVDAGWNPQALRGEAQVYISISMGLFSPSNVLDRGVYVGIGNFTNTEEMRREKTDGYMNIGVCLGQAANRASYCFDFKGPSYSMDTACSSSIYAFVNAVKDMQMGLTDAAIVCGAHLILHPHESLEFKKLNMLSDDCKCKVFSSARDGYARSEGIVSVFLQRENVSRRIYASVLGAKANSDGNKPEGITYPSTVMQLSLMSDVYGMMGVNPDEVSYVEAHGTGTPAGDVEELLSIVNMFCKKRKEPLLVGAVKSNMGHSETSSGLCSLSKILIAMESGTVPANLHTDPLDTELPGIKEGKIKQSDLNMLKPVLVPFLTPYAKPPSFNLHARREDYYRYVGVDHGPYRGHCNRTCSVERRNRSTEFVRFWGSNAHIILKSNPKEKKPYKPPKHRLVHVSGRTEEAVNYFLDGVEKNQNDEEFLALVDEIHKENMEGHTFRGEVGRYTGKRPIWFIYTGMGSQWCGMGKDLMKIDVFRKTIKRCAVALKPYNIDLEDILTSTSPSVFDNISNNFTAIAAVEIALTDVLHSLGIFPDNVAGHSLGEVVASYADGQITPEQAVLLAYARGYASENIKLPAGQMAAVGLSKEECLSQLPDDIFIACVNGKKSVTISGPLKSTNEFVQKLSAQGVFARAVNSAGLAYHSKYVTDAGPLLYDFAKKVLPHPKPRSAKWISTSVPSHRRDENWTRYNCAEYHRNNFCSPVLFDQIYQHMPENAIVVEVAPHGLMQAILKRELGPEVANVSLANRSSEDNEQFFLSSIGNGWSDVLTFIRRLSERVGRRVNRIYVAGGQPNLRNFYSDVKFPVSRGTQMLSSLVRWDHSHPRYVPYWKNRDSFGDLRVINLSDEKYSYLEGHNIDGRVLMPATGYLELVWSLFADMHLKDKDCFPVVIENVKFLRATVLPPNGEVKFLTNIMKQSGYFEIFEGGSVVVSGTISAPKNIAGHFTNTQYPDDLIDNSITMQRDDIYKECHLRRYKYNGLFQGIKECDVYGTHGIAEWKGQFTSFLDSMLHLGIVADSGRDFKLPKSIEKLVIDPAEHLRMVSSQKGEPSYTLLPTSEQCQVRGHRNRRCGVHSGSKKGSKFKPPVVEKYEFVAYDENPTKPEENFNTSLQTAIQIILQNTVGTTKKEKYDMLLIAEESVDEANLGDILQHLNANGFILYIGDVLKNGTSGLQIIYQSTTDKHNFYLLKPKKELPSNYTVVNVRNSDFEWLDEIKEILKGNEKQVVYLVSQEETSGIIGLAKCLLAESVGLKFRVIFIEDKSSDVFSVDNKFYRKQLEKDLTFNVLRNNRWGTLVHLPLEPIEDKAVTDASVSILTPGDLSTLHWVQMSSSYAQYHPQSELIDVVYSSLNFKDVMIATGKLQLPPGTEPTAPELSIGFEYSGVSSGSKRVMGMIAYECLALRVQNDPLFTWEVPDAWSLEEAATVPCVYATCYYAMIIRGQMKQGDTILIHAGSGGIGLAAISIALSMSCTVYTTVGSQEKKDYLIKVFPQLKPRNIGNSRNASFKNMILQNTNGKGVDLVLNSLSAELFQESLKCIAMRGTFLEIGKVDFFNGTPINSGIFLKNCTFHGILLDDLFDNNLKVNQIKEDIHKLLAAGIRNGVVKPLSRTVFSETEIENAFRYLASGKHKGKVLIKIREENRSSIKTIVASPKIYFDPNKSYILIGGLGGVGLEVTDWMIRKGAKKFVLNSRCGLTNGYQSYCFKKWARFNNITVKVNKDDTSVLEGAAKLVADARRIGPIGGVFNMALVLKDALIENQTKEMYEEVFKCKILSGQNMDAVTRETCPELDHFVVFSSIASGRGNSGQTNYAMANSALERLCEKRKREKFAGSGHPVGSNRRCGDIVGSSVVLTNKNQSAGVSLKTPAEAVAHILGIRNIDMVEKNIPLSQMGLDSLMVAEIKQTLYRNYQLELTVDEIRALTIDSLIEIEKGDEKVDNCESTPHPHVNGKNGHEEYKRKLVILKETVVKLSTNDSSKEIMFLIHPIEGHLEMLKELASQIKSTVYGIQCTKEADYETLHDYAFYFIKKMKTKQTKGPYLLCGYSYGSLVAFEMGLQLERSGENVRVISVDGSPLYVKSILEDGFARRERSVEQSKRAILSNFACTFSNLDEEEVKQLIVSTERWENQVQAVSEFISKDSGVSDKDVVVSIDRYYKRCHAGYFYEPKAVLKGTLTLIRRETTDSMPEDYGLNKICAREVEVFKVNGDHRTILIGDNARSISQIINHSVLTDG
ncbi:hypothetical protein NQ317_001270 [Molorchus minor]|uniref:Fatty acid synthase n=1 Tax=Molorchus minor TaxID=1323400 RepID=A0ABQ9IT03_9CUCU|nr:hypothetical protein NQ317_001270 [Molorchus minor]